MADYSERSKFFTALLYLDSAPSNWLDILKEQHVNCLVSPLHDKDVNEDGTLKKPHYHLMPMFDSLKSVRQARDYFSFVNAVPPPNDNIIVHSKRQMARYLCHLDDPDKYQYDKSDVIIVGDIDYLEVINCIQDEDKIFREILEVINDNDIIFFNDLVDVLASFPRYSEHLRLVTRKFTLSLTQYLKSKEFKERVIALSNK